LSSFGAMFAPHHQVVADELTRVTRPGGTIAMTTWIPEGFIGRFFAAQAAFLPPPAAGVEATGSWGVESHVREVFGDRVSGLTFTPTIQAIDRFATPEVLIDYYKENFGPVIMTYRSLGDDAARRAELDAALVEVARDTNLAAAGEHARWEFEYALIVATRG
jgi:hypothetical protein